ncbi:helix-turn-helix transcriptional regulator [Streptomyces sp. PSKA28]|uniref:Helix-turn-helix transcriptional regulator n=1 Tax=Streptomyces himalayensis subsp. himalayensis TaxID=2756131 RepID=A0A7W0DKH4_9ACTN|nr:helix-turn-helix transcriptional regulator [Streptomyces himalayensis subsp. himalayensis]
MSGAEQSARAEVDALLDAGLRLMTEGAPRPPRVADIVAAAGLSNDAFYRAFSGRDALVSSRGGSGGTDGLPRTRQRWPPFFLLRYANFSSTFSCPETVRGPIGRSSSPSLSSIVCEGRAGCDRRPTLPAPPHGPGRRTSPARRRPA